MTTIEAVRSDWQNRPTEPVTVTPVGGSAVATARAERAALDRRAAQYGAMVSEAAEFVFVLWDATLGGIAPRQGDRITDAAGKGYLIQSVQAVYSCGVAVKWRCVCIETA